MKNGIYFNESYVSELEQGDWEKAQSEILSIEENLKGAVEWWNRESVVGREEKSTCIFTTDDWE